MNRNQEIPRTLSTSFSLLLHFFTASFLYFFASPLSAQDTKFELVKSIPVSSENFTTDNLGNLYVINEHTLEKYDGTGKLLKTYSNKRFGKITSADAGNPLKIIVFYEAFQQIVILDNMLAPSAEPVSLQERGYNQVSLVCASHDNGMWIYDKQNFSLIRFDNNLQETAKTENITRLVLSDVQPVFLLEQNNRLFLADTSEGIFVFDVFGMYHKTIPFKGVTAMQVFNDELIYFSAGKLKSHNLKTLEETEINLPTKNVSAARSEKEKLYLLTQKTLQVYYVKKR